MRNFSDLDQAVVTIKRSEDGGTFSVRSPSDGRDMLVIVSDAAGWDHVSVSRKNHPPNWAEMDYVKRLFFNDDETAVQFHVPPTEHINMHTNVLHLWRPQGVEIPRPPSIMVGVGGRPARDLADAQAMVREAVNDP